MVKWGQHFMSMASSLFIQICILLKPWHQFNFPRIKCFLLGFFVVVSSWPASVSHLFESSLTRPPGLAFLWMAVAMRASLPHGSWYIITQLSSHLWRPLPKKRWLLVAILIWLVPRGLIQLITSNYPTSHKIIFSFECELEGCKWEISCVVSTSCYIEYMWPHSSCIHEIVNV